MLKKFDQIKKPIEKNIFHYFPSVKIQIDQ